MNILTVDYQSKNAAEEFTNSLRDTGFAVLKNHPLNYEKISKTFKEWEDFFSSSYKTRYKFDPKIQSGYFPFKSENAKDHKVKDLKEFYHYYAWSKLPEEMPKTTESVYVDMQTLGSELLNWIEEHTPEATRKEFTMPLSDTIIDSRETLLRVIHYPPMQGDEEEGAIRAAAHEDINLITLLPAATAPGLQVKDSQGKWIEVTPDPGTLVINAGDMLQEMTKHYYKSTTHQVVNPKSESAKTSRFSMPLFIHPRRDVRLSPRHTAGSYLDERLKEIGLK